MIPAVFPPWAILGLLAALISVAIPLIQERLRANGFALAVMVKLVTCLSVAPFVLKEGFPDSPVFYACVALTSLLWCVSDVIYFRSVPLAGAGVISRLLPSAVLISFILWFAFDPSLIGKYLQKPWQSGAIAAVIASARIVQVQFL